MPAMTRKNSAAAHSNQIAIWTHRATYWLLQHWILGLALVAGLYAGLPWLAPDFMRLGWTSAGEAIYAIYSTQCHQLPQRSFFLFGRQTMYALDQIQPLVGGSRNPLALRQFIGNAGLGWKVGWSDRMVAMYTGVLLLGLLYWPLRRRIRPLSWWGFGLLMLPLGVDGLTHLVSDLAGIGRGFRDSNAWLAALTGNSLPAAFYAGDALGSFNGWMRQISGVLFALGMVWLAFPYLDQSLSAAADQIKAKFDQAGLQL
ncbi:MAG: DUF2085 domain-containing protein [Anaerolineales bacterium]